MLFKIHRILGVSLIFFILLLSFTGLALQHPDYFETRKKFIGPSMVKFFYDIKPCEIYGFEFEEQWILTCNNKVFINDIKILSNFNEIHSVQKVGDDYKIGIDKFVLTISDEGEITKSFNKITGEKTSPVFSKVDNTYSKLIEYDELAKVISYERIIVDMHTGRIFGVAGISLIDIISIGIILLSITGFITWLKRKLTH